ncbi:M91 family zinc metallopeptidase [Catellatospora sp. KI3]|uniref:M91 family zinc metallopeptidase n=1 Tax=Catellatospora sp. KI3 TaxID=3041620 RepID=UPI0024830624|nr:M91 family zinc metallopeptidase [Catellatospora sp. KI3]MDI1465989.1 M91 family zinc metallopeptidase [Catellatospora sp. KI3]
MTAVGTAPPVLVRVPPLWALAVRSAPLLAAAAAWRDCATAADRAAADLTDPARFLTPSSAHGPDRPGRRGAEGSTHESGAGQQWRGQDADAFAARSRHLADRLTVFGRTVRRTASALEDLAARTERTERHLDESLARVTAAVPHHAAPERIMFAVTGPGAERLVRGAVAEAEALRADLEGAARTAAAALEAATDALRWLAEPPTPIAGPDLVEALTLHAPGLTVVRTGTADDTVTVTVEHGQVVVRAGDRAVAVLDPARDHGRIVLRTGAGDDRVRVDPAVPIPVTVLAGAGADLVDGGDVLVGGAGRDTLLAGVHDALLLGGGARDYLQGDSGDDLLDGGDGDDTAYGLDGDDTLRGGTGHDHLDGGRGADDLRGEADPDTLAPGAGADLASGGSATDLGYLDRTDTTGGPGTGSRPGTAPDLDGRSDVEHVHVRTEPGADDPGQHIRVEGSARFQARVESDLDLLRSSPLGRGMLAELDQLMAGPRPDERGVSAWWPNLGPPPPEPGVLTIRELPTGTDNAYAAVEDGHHVVGYDPSFDGLGGTAAGGDATPVAVLYHEFAHVWDHAHGYGYEHGHHADDVMWDGSGMVPVPAAERVAVGLPVDDDGDPTTPDRLHPRHPYPLTENALRAELGERPRVSYGDTLAASVTSP